MWVRRGAMLAVVLAAAATAQRTNAAARQREESGISVRKLTYTLSDAERAATGLASLPVTLTLPAADVELVQQHRHQMPLILLYSGFKMRTSYYSLYARGLAARGYAVVQYDLPLTKYVQDRDEAALAPSLLHWLQQLAAADSLSSKLKAPLDLQPLGVAGHSRGAKLATLVFTGHPDIIQGAYLIDPVDNTAQTPESPSCPSAVKALAASGQAVAISGAGIIGSCNPVGSNFHNFFSAAASSSWLVQVPDAGHGQFLKAPWLLDKAFDLLCGRGKDSHAETIGLTLPPMLAWFDQHLQHPQPNIEGTSEQTFLEWVKAEEALRKISFTVKQ